MDKQNEVLEQDLSKKERPGAVFVIKLLMKEMVEMPNKEETIRVMQKHLDEVECFWHDELGAGLSVKKYLAQYKDAALPPQLMITQCSPFDSAEIDELQKSQMWDCIEDKERIFKECKYEVLATDMLAATLPVMDRADLDMDFTEALVELFPECEAVLFVNSGKMFLAEEIRRHQLPREDRFIYFAVNARFFNILETDDMVVDTLGMSILFLSDIQYHFHGMEPDKVVKHAYQFASYIFKNDNSIEGGDTIDGLVDGLINQGEQWSCHYEEAMVQPVREVIDVCMGEFASGGRGSSS